LSENCTAAQPCLSSFARLPPFKINQRLHFPARVCAKYTRNRLISCVAERGPSRVHTRNVKSVKKYCRANPLWYLAATFTEMDSRRLRAAILDLRKIFPCTLHGVQLQRLHTNFVYLSYDSHIWSKMEDGDWNAWCKRKYNNNHENIIPRAHVCTIYLMKTVTLIFKIYDIFTIKD